MDRDLQASVESVIAKATGHSGRIRTTSVLGGGCINRAEAVTTEEGERFLVKSNPDPLPGLFEREAEALRALAEAGAIRVPRPLGTGGGEKGTCPFIVMEYIQPGTPGPGFFDVFGRQFAELHKTTGSDRFGFAHDNYLGSSPQPNGWTEHWVDFWRDNRLGFQLNLARRNGYSDPEMDRLGDNLLTRLEEWMGQPDEPPCLLHGDLWGGNYLASTAGEPVLIDPAAYYGRREADLAMTMLFGGFHKRFHESYEEAWPLESGSEERLEIYKLYHLLNHLNLFGSGYRSGCMAILKRFR